MPSDNRPDWLIFYSDGTIATSNEHQPDTVLRRVDVQVIVQKNADHNWVTLSGYDYYMWDDRGRGFKWFGGDNAGLQLYLYKPGWKCVLFGEMIEPEVFWEVMNRAQTYMGEKLGWGAQERH